MFKDLDKKPVKGFIISQNLLASRGVEGRGNWKSLKFVLELTNTCRPLINRIRIVWIKICFVNISETVEFSSNKQKGFPKVNEC